jgi:hypothetical protein
MGIEPQQKKTQAKAVPKQKKTQAKAVPKQKKTQAKAVPKQKQVRRLRVKSVQTMLQVHTLLAFCCL